MITATLKIRYADDWVSNIGEYDVVGRGVASSFRDRQFLGITSLDVAAADYADVIETMRGNEYVSSLDVLETYDTDDGRVLCTVLTRCLYPSYTPLQIALLEGFIPLEYVEYRDGYEYLQILAENRDQVSNAVSALDFETVEVVRIVSEFERRPGVSLLGWQRLVGSISEDERELVAAALENGYFRIPREMSLADLADETGVAKSTASKRLRNVERQVIPYVTKYLRTFSN
ncbi:helix-turn-helix domain-containing protein [Halobacteriales archaeon QS_1_68_17]|jgi:predicted DNA binding protein|nr:MAG: helix-turn-helix domain-containing protein [Halobacteriales archaeon QS_1_68_17]